MQLTARAAERSLRALADTNRVAVLRRFFKTGAGEYGEGDRFLGVTMPQLRRLAKELRGLPLNEIEKLLDSPMHEVRTLAVVMLANGYAKASDSVKERIYRLYLRRTDRINNWDLVDISAPQVIGAHLMNRSRAPLVRLARSASLWERRISIIATLYFIKRDDFGDTLKIARTLLDDDHDLIHKAVGWMLREVGQRSEPTLRSFLDRHASAMPRTALRYAIEKFSPARRKQYLTIARVQ